MAVKMYEVASKLICSGVKQAMVVKNNQFSHLSGIEYGRTEKAKEYKARDNPGFHKSLLGPPG